MAIGTNSAKNFEINTLTDWRGYNSAYDKTKIAPNFLVSGSRNVYKKKNGNIANRFGLKRRGEANSTLAGVKSETVWNTSWGAEYVLWVADGKLQVEIDEVWYTLLDSLTDTRFVFDSWWDNTEKKDRLLFVDGNDYIQHWAGGYAEANAQVAGGSTLTKSGSTSWQQAGFSTTSGEKKFKINGSSTEYTYTGGESTTTLTGITPALPTITQGDKVFSSVITEANKPADGFSNDFIKVINNQVYVGSYTSRLCYISSSTDFKDYVVPTPREPGDPELLTLDGALKGIGVRQGKAYIGFGSSSWAIVTFNDITVGTTLTQQTTVDVKPVAIGQAPYAHEMIDTVGDSLVYLAQDNQVRVFGDFNNLFTPGYPSISQEICTELEGVDFTLGQLKCIGEFVYLTAPNIGTTYLYQVRQSVDASGQVIAERLWHAPFILNASRIDAIGQEIVAFSSSNPQVYYVWDTNQWYDDSPSDEPIPYTSMASFAYRSNNRRQGLQEFDKVFTEGYISGGGEFNLLVNYNYEGSTNQIQTVVNSISRPVYTFSQQIASLGDESLGESSLGDQEELDTIPKFKCINSLPLVSCFEYQLNYYSDTTNSRWEILASGTNAELSALEQANFIINKL